MAALIIVVGSSPSSPIYFIDIEAACALMLLTTVDPAGFGGPCVVAIGHIQAFAAFGKARPRKLVQQPHSYTTFSTKAKPSSLQLTSS